MGNKRFYWLKLQENFFTEPKIKKLRRIAGGDTFTIIYLKMQLLSVKNGGVLQYEGIESTFAEELALTLDEDVDNVQVTLSYLLAQGLIEEGGENSFLLTEAVKNIGSEGNSAQRVREFRERKEQKALQCNAPVTMCNTEKEREKRIENREDKEQEQETDEVDDVDLPFDGGSFNAVQFSQDLDALEYAWKRMGNRASDTARDTMTELLQEYGLQNVLDAMKAADEQGKGSRWPYIKAILANWKKNGRHSEKTTEGRLYEGRMRF